MSELIGVGSYEIDSAWPQVKPFVERAMQRSTTETVASVYDALKTKAAWLWVAMKDETVQSICIVQISDRPKNKICSIWICTGSSRKEWTDFHSMIEAWAKHNGCTLMRHEARLGWAREMKKYGYAPSHIINEKRI